MVEWPREDNLNPRDFWQDPDLDRDGKPVPGMLLSDRIEYYIDKVGLIRFPEENYKELVRDNIRPASFDLRLGQDYYIGRDFGRLSDEKPFLVIPPNQIAFVSTLETVHVPLYLVGRFDLRIQLIYSGLVLGTGPQVDPGFKGRLSCPLYNLSDHDIVLKYRETFATIDFTKTTPFAQNDPSLPSYDSFERLKEAARREGKNGLPGIHGPGDGSYLCKLFGKDTSRLTLADYLRRAGGGRQSSLKELEGQISEIRKSQETFTNRFFALQLLSFIIFVVLAGTFITYSVKWTNTVDALVKRLEEVQVRQAPPLKAPPVKGTGR